MKKQFIFNILALLLLLFPHFTFSQITGKVFRDFNANGVQGTTSPNNEPNVAGVIVNAYNDAGAIIASYTTTYATGYSIPASGTYNGIPGSNTGGVPSSTKVRLEFIVPANGCLVNSMFDYPSYNQASNATSVQFVTGGATGVNYAVNDPGEYSATTNPEVVIPVIVPGDPLVPNGIISTRRGIVDALYNTTGYVPNPVREMPVATIGAVWGLAYSKQANKLFTSAYIRRHAGLGPMGSGGIYMLTPSGNTYTTTNFYDMDASTSSRTRAAGNPAFGEGVSYSISNSSASANDVINYLGAIDPVSGAPVGMGVVGTNPARGLTDDPINNFVDYDASAFGQVGKVGLGDIEISEDGKYLFVTNLYDRKIYRLTLNDAKNPTSVIAVTSYALPSVTVVNGVLRPFGLKFKRDKLYVGAVSTGENGGTTADMNAYVFELNNATSTASFNSNAIITVPLNYTKGTTFRQLSSSLLTKAWRPWRDTTSSPTITYISSSYISNPEPLLSGLEFDERGNMILAFLDRSGSKFGAGSHRDLKASTNDWIYFITGGDILMASRNCNGTYTLENNGSITASNGVTYTSGGVGNGEGPGGGEFFYKDAFIPTSQHNEVAQGAVALFYGSDSIMLAQLDPYDAFEGGCKPYSTINGGADLWSSTNNVDRGFTVTNNSFIGAAMENNYFGKSNAIGDVEMVTELQPMEIGNRVWYDANGNGIQDPSELPIANVTLDLYSNGLDLTAGTNDDVLLGSTTTDANGTYYFNNTNVADGDPVTPGNQIGIQLNSNYNIRVNNADWTSGAGTGDLANLALTTSNAVGTGAADLSDNDAVLIGSIPTINVVIGNNAISNHTYDFGFTPVGSIGNYVWTDVNGNGINDESSTSGINGVKVYLLNSSNVIIDSTTTANNGGNPGYYLFPNLTSGTYYIKFPTSNVGNNLTTQTATSQTDNNSDASTTTGISPAVVIDANGTGQDKDNTTIDAGYLSAKAYLGNYVWNDINQDGIQNNGEVGVSGVTVSLLNATTNAIMATITTDAYGYYQFSNLDAGSYKVQFSLPSNYVFTSQNAPNDATDSDPNIFTGITDLYTLAPGDSNMTVDAGIYQPLPTTATVGDRVWFDVNGDGLQTPGESGISGITVTLYNCANPGVPVSTTITDAGGNYLFENVLPGSYKVGFSVPIGMVLTTQTGVVSTTDNSDVDPLTERTACFPVVGGDHITYVDAGLKLKPITTSSLGDKVWNDANQNGIQDANETGVQGVTVTLYDATGTTVIATTETNGLGNYGFNGITPGCYVVGFGLPVGYTRSVQGAGSDTSKNSDANATTGMTNQICITAGQNNPTIDAGIYNAANTNSIGDKVWYDVNHDGIQDPSEYGFPGVVVTLYDCATNTIMATTTTNANGNYLFDGIANGSYYVGFGFVTGYQFTGANADVAGVLGENNSDANPSNGLTACVTLAGNTNITSIDAGVYPGNTRNATSSLGDIVWTDANNNGLQDNGETGVSGVKVTLYEADGTTIIDTTITDGLGNYIFTNLDGGNYVIGFSNLPSGYTFTTQSGSIENEANSDANVTTGKTSVIALGLGEDKMTVDAGLVAPIGTVCLGDYVWIDLNNDGIQDANEPAVPGVTVKLYDNNTNSILQIATTNSAGQYLFCGLTNGNTYSVGFENLPAGYVFTTQIGALSVADNSDANPLTGRTTTVTLGASNDLTLDAGIYSATTAVVGNYVWYDENANGIQDANEAPISGVLVTMYDNTNTAVASAVTDANGGYLFTNVTPGTYTIGFEGYPSTLVPTTKGTNANADDDSNVDPITGRTDAFTVTAGSSNLTLDAGYKANPIAGLGNYVWYDINENGLQDASEPSISGVVVTLYQADGTTVVATAITDGNGAYSFPNLPAGDYVVGFTAPSVYTRTQVVGTLNDPLNSDIDATNKTGVITLVAGTYNPNIDAGFYIGIPLPAKVLQATVAIIKDATKCEVNWYTKEEMNTNNFAIERSIDGTNYTTVGSQRASGNTTGRTDYVYNDNIETVKNANIIYYRIKLTDIDNKYYYSNTISVKPMSNTNGDIIVIYPTPFTHQLMVDYTSLETSDVQIQITDASGRVITQQMNSIEVGMNHIKVTNLDALSAGQYFIKIKDLNTGDVFTRKIVK